jgi:DNA-binding NarL/FixJ family response regulator
MIELLVVDADEERRADIADALCELPGIEVRATVANATAALELIDQMTVDAIVTTNDLPGASMYTLIDNAHRRGLTDIIVAVADRPTVPGVEATWRDLGARHIVETMPELVDRVAALDTERAGGRANPRATVALRMQVLSALEKWAAQSPVYVSSRTSAAPPQPTRTLETLPLTTALHESLARLGGVVPREVQVYLRAAPDLPAIRAARADFQQLVLLLVRDACSALPLGGNVWLFAERDRDDRVHIEILDSSGTARIPADLDVLRTIAGRIGGELRIVELAGPGGPTCVQVTLRAAAAPVARVEI